MNHVRMLTFAISDGATAGPTDRGYVLRKVVRRAMRYARRSKELYSRATYGVT